MEKLIKKLRGNRVYLLIPETKSSSIILTDEAKRELIGMEKEKLLKLVVYAKGETVTDIEEGDVVMVEPGYLEKCPVVPLKEGFDVILVSSIYIAHVW
jgi:hypothetical protein